MAMFQNTARTSVAESPEQGSLPSKSEELNVDSQSTNQAFQNQKDEAMETYLNNQAMIHESAIDSAMANLNPKAGSNQEIAISIGEAAESAGAKAEEMTTELLTAQGVDPATIRRVSKLARDMAQVNAVGEYRSRANPAELDNLNTEFNPAKPGPDLGDDPKQKLVHEIRLALDKTTDPFHRSYESDRERKIQIFRTINRAAREGPIASTAA